MVIPARDERARIGDCLRALADQTCGRDAFTVVLVADRCADDTVAIALRAARSLPLALICTAVLSAGHAVGVASVVTLLVRRSGTLRGTALTLNASGMSLGLFLGAAAGGVGLAAGGYLWAAAVFGAFTAISVGAAMTVRHGGV